MTLRTIGALPALVIALVTGGITMPGQAQESAHAFTFTDIDGAPLPLSRFSDKAMLIVNTASRCGFTRQYGDLQKLYETYQDQGLVVIGVPSNDFGAQEPGTEAQIKSFCEVNWDVKFPLTEKVAVKGDSAHPFYAWTVDTLGTQAAPQWNFHKILVGRDGRLLGTFASSVEPMSDTMTDAVEKALMPD